MKNYLDMIARETAPKPKPKPVKIAVADKGCGCKEKKPELAKPRQKPGPKPRPSTIAPAAHWHRFYLQKVRADYPRKKELAIALTKSAFGCFTQKRHVTGKQKTECIRAAWARVRSEGRFSDYFKESSPMAKKKRTAKQKAASMRNLAKARRALKAKGGHHKPRKKAKRAHEKLPGGRVKVKKHTVHFKQKNVPTSSYTRHQKKHNKQRGPYTYKQTPKQKRASLANLAKARRAAKSMTRSHGKSSKKRAKENPLSGSMAMDNPITVMEGATVGILLVTGFFLASLTDRVIATHALTPATNDPADKSLFDAPKQGQLYNGDAIAAPMNLGRWAAAAGAPFLLALGGHFIPVSMARIAVNSFAFGWLVRGLGKGADDLMAKLTGKTKFGARLYPNEIAALNIAKQQKDNPQAAQLPAAGAMTLGACCSSKMQTTTDNLQPPPRQTVVDQPPPDAPPPPPIVDVSPPRTREPLPPVQAPPPAPPRQTTIPRSPALGPTGAPAVGAGALPRSRFAWAQHVN